MARRLLPLLLAAVAGAGPALETRVAEAVQRGAGFLLSRFERKTGWGGAVGTGTYGDGGPAYPYPAGPTALACFALLKAGVPPDHKVLKQAFSFLRVEHRTPAVAYELSVELLAVAEWAGAKRCPDYRRGERRQARTNHRFRKPPGHPFETEHWTWMADLAKKLLTFQGASGGWRYYPNDFHEGGPADVSSTQFALLALSTASRCGYDVPPEAFRKARRFLLESQQETGPEAPRAIHVPGGPADAMDRARGFPYIAKSLVLDYQRVSGGMTAAGVASLLLVKDELGPDPEVEQAILDGFAWLGRYFTVRVNPGYQPFLEGSYHFVWLYALERCGDLAAREVIGGRSWFAEGARHFLDAQREDGSIPDPTCMNPKDTLGTSLALLFLTRSAATITER